MKWLIARSVFALIALTFLGPPAWAGKVGREFRINRYITNDQAWPFVAGLNGGGFVAVWDSFEQDGSEEGVYGRRYDSAGKRVGKEFRVNTSKNGRQRGSSIAALDGGGFVVTWGSTQRTGVYGQRFDDAGGPVGKEFRVTRESVASSVAGLHGGGFVVTWAGSDNDGGAVYGQRYDDAGGRFGTEFQVNTFTINDQLNPYVARLSGGGFVVTWSSLEQEGNYKGWGIYGQRYDSAGGRVGKEFHVNNYTTDDQGNGKVAGLSDGGFVVTWQSDGQDGSQLGIYGRRYDSAGKRVGKEFCVNTYTVDFQAGPSVVGLEGGGFVVTWQGYGQDGSSAGVYGQRYDSAGKHVRGEFRVNTFTTGFQGLASVAKLEDGGFVVAWTSAGQDGDEDGIYGQRYAP